MIGRSPRGRDRKDGMQTSTTLPAPEPLKAGLAVFLDLDGTLAPIAARPRDVCLDEAHRALLRSLSRRLGGRMAILSGRTIADVDRILGGAIVPVAGVHGLERRAADGGVQRAEPGAGLAAARSVLRAYVAQNPDLLLEDKGLSLGLHFRAAPRLRAQCQNLADRLAAAHDLALQPGDMVIELRTRGPQKGDALAAFMAEPPFADGEPTFVGDDLTDEDAFVTVHALGGTGVLVGPARPTAATRGLADVEAVFAWLETSITGNVSA